jgi:hypothetical protein
MRRLRWAACVLCAAAALHAFPASADTHALIMTIGEYQQGVPPLSGVKYDGDSARAIARRMGVKDENLRHYKDGELTYDGMTRAFDDLEGRVADNDQVFIYYSGHGGRQLVRDPEERCAESLVTADRRAFTDAELEARLKRLSAKAHKLVVFLDACHSGGVTTRGAAAADAPFSPKFYARSGPDACSKPTNVITQQLQTRSIGRGANNYVYIAAARDNEVSLDQPNKGGVATQAWRDCMASAPDKDGSGGLSAAEIGECAQERIERTLKNVKGFTPHHVSITGNRNAVLAFSERAAPAPGEAQLKPSAQNTLLDIYNSRDDRRTVTLESGRPAFRIGRDSVEFTLSSSHAGYIYLLMVGSDGKTFDMLFPNQLDAANYIQAGQTLRLPRPAWEIKPAGPAGKNHLLAIVADAPRDFGKLGMQAAGPFSMVSASAAASKDIQLVTATPAASGSAECSEPPAKRSLVVQQRCSNAYGAALTALEEVD